MTNHGKTFAVALHLVMVSCMKPMEYLIQQICGKIFAIECKIVKTAKVKFCRIRYLIATNDQYTLWIKPKNQIMN